MKSQNLLNEIVTDAPTLHKAGITVGWFIEQIEKLNATSFKVVYKDRDKGEDEKALRYDNYLSMKNVTINRKDAMVKLDFYSDLSSKIARDLANGFSLKRFENGFAKNLGSNYKNFILKFHTLDGKLFMYGPIMPSQFLIYKKNPKCCIVVMRPADDVLKKQSISL